MSDETPAKAVKPKSAAVKPRRERTVNGVRYVLVNGGWKRAGN